MRPRVPRPGDLPSRLHDVRVAARVGRWLGVCFALAFVTGLLSHYAQAAHQPIPLPTRPVWGYQVTQALHVLSGTAAVPLLLVKLWTVYPRLFQRPPRELRAVVLTVLERGSIALLVGAALFEVTTGLVNVTQWYPWQFSFRRAHYAVAWVAAGALLVHVAVKLPVIRDALARDLDETAPQEADRPAAPVDRRGLLRLTWLAAGTAAVASAGGTLPGLDRLAVLSARRAGGPQGVPVNRTARAAGVVAEATDPGWVCELRHRDRVIRLGRDELLSLPQRTVDLPIACVEGWSAVGTWSGVRLWDLLRLVEATGGADVAFHSLQRRRGGRFSVLPAPFASDPLTLVALGLNGAPLSLDHGFPARLIAPNRPGVTQTKWLARIEVLG
ncbi:molybdopterin-dependent oxidoreductase [Nocardioides carbamazepini]|uniref:molybdopterin-dependent oxidoreductase n=1 Tax=Nocardioides carbamazepini TaxID=2854259 RepID=UPI002149E602|nr:molybdopterin-dependent oxidoreductase [Nocardioides carbamazepini]